MKKIFLAALAATTLFASCAKEENGVRDNSAEAKLDLTIAFPQTETRADQANNANAQDVQVDNITVFIFYADGTPADGNGTTFNDIANEFTATPATHTYALKESKRITTKSGTKKIYVGINLPTDLQGDIAESVLIDAASTTGLWTDAATNAPDGHVAMLSRGQMADLKPQAEGVPDPTANKVDVTVERLVAKITVTQGSTTSFPLNGDDAATSTFTVTPDQFTVGNLAPQFYPIQRVVNSKLVTPKMTTATPAILPQVALNAQTVAKDITSYFYVPEHATTASNLREEATYAVVRGELTYTHLAEVNASNVLELTEKGAYASDLWGVTYEGNTYFCKTEAIAEAVGAKLGLGAKIATKPYESVAGKYYTYYYLFINKDNDKKTVAVYRNQFINMTIGDVKGIGVPGKPGKPEEPPITIPDPKDPIFETEAFLEVIVDVQKWDYKTSNVDLE